MALDVERYFDRRRLKRRLTFWRIVAVVLAVGLLVALFSDTEGLPRKSIAVLDVSSIITDDQDRIDALDDLADNARVKALIVHIDSPGGTVVGGENLYTTLRRVAEKKPVVAVLGDLATSAGYMTAIAADHIVARQGTITGSIGVLMQTVEVTGLLEKLGINAEAIKSSPLKASPSPLEKTSPEAREAAEDIIKDMYAMFVDMVAERRGMAHDRVVQLADGRVYTGRQAVANGLIDAIGGEREALDWLKSAKGVDSSLPLVDVEIHHKEGLLSSLLGETFGKAMFSERLRLDGLISLWHPELR
jgi:protease-4